MEAFEDSDGQSFDDSLSLYKRYVKSFHLTEHKPHDNNRQELLTTDDVSTSSKSTYENINEEHNINSGIFIGSQVGDVLLEQNSMNNSRHSETTLDKNSLCSTHSLLHDNKYSTLPEASLFVDNSSTAIEGNNSTDKFAHICLPVSSEDTKSDNSCKYPKPVVITSLITMENSNNAVDSVPLFHNTRPSGTVFKLPISELSFNGTIKHVQKLQPMVDPITALSSGIVVDNTVHSTSSSDINNEDLLNKNDSDDKSSDVTDEKSYHAYNRGVDDATESTGDSQYQDFNPQKDVPTNTQDDTIGIRSSMDQSYSSIEASFDSGVRSPELFSEDEYTDAVDPEASENFWDFIADHEASEKILVKKMEVRFLFYIYYFKIISKH